VPIQAMEDEYKKFTADDKSNVVAAGGLMVIGTERHESRRIDNQLRGRSGRYGTPVSSLGFSRVSTFCQLSAFKQKAGPQQPATAMCERILNPIPHLQAALITKVEYKTTSLHAGLPHTYTVLNTLYVVCYSIGKTVAV